MQFPVAFEPCRGEAVPAGAVFLLVHHDVALAAEAGQAVARRPLTAIHECHKDVGGRLRLGSDRHEDLLLDLGQVVVRHVVASWRRFHGGVVERSVAEQPDGLVGEFSASGAFETDEARVVNREW